MSLGEHRSIGLVVTCGWCAEDVHLDLLVKLTNWSSGGGVNPVIRRTSITAKSPTSIHHCPGPLPSTDGLRLTQGNPS